MSLIERLTELLADEEKRRELPKIEQGEMTVAEAHRELLATGQGFEIEMELAHSEKYGSSLRWKVYVKGIGDDYHNYVQGNSLRHGVEMAVAKVREFRQPADEKPADAVAAADAAVESLREAEPLPL